MVKQIILNQEEFERLIDIAAQSLLLLDSYTYKENKGREKHIMDTDEVLPEYKKLFHGFLYMEDDMKDEIIKKLPKKYLGNTKEGAQSVLAESDALW